MIEFYENVSKINTWANSLLRNNLENQNDELFFIETPYGLLGDVIAHLFEAINLWINRIEGEEPGNYIRRLNDFKDLHQLFSEWKIADKRLEDFIRKCKVKNMFQDSIPYRTSKGKQYTSTIGEILFHISHHGYQHRSQLAMLLRLHEKRPMPPQDVIFYFREKKQ
jgi:uncharacterized damage-inducible protein DinB